MKMQWILSGILSLLAEYVLAQVTGRITDQNLKLVADVTILLLSEKDSTVVRTGISDGSGRYILSGSK